MEKRKKMLLLKKEKIWKSKGKKKDAAEEWIKTTAEKIKKKSAAEGEKNAATEDKRK